MSMLNILDHYPKLKELLDYIVDMVSSSLRITSIYVFGDITLADYSEMYSMINVLVVLEKTLWGEDFDIINDIMEKTKQHFPLLSRNLDVAFIPEQIIENPRINFEDLEGMRIIGNEGVLITSYPYNHLETYLLHNKAHKLYGRDVSLPFPAVDAFWEQFIEDLPKLEHATERFPFQDLPSTDSKEEIEWILYFPRLLYGLANNDIIGKLKAAYWFNNEYDNDLGEFVVEVAMNWKRGHSLEHMLDVPLNAQQFLIFSLEKALELRKKTVGRLASLVISKENKYDYKRLFIEVRNAIEV